MRKADLIDSFEYEGKTIKVEWFDADAIDKLPDVVWQQVYALCNLNGGVSVVMYEHARANLPGGKPEPGENIESTLRRELAEELNCRVISWHPIGYQKLVEPGVQYPVFQLRVYAEVETAGDFIEDVGGKVIGYKVVELKHLNDAINYGKVGRRLIELTESEFDSLRTEYSCGTNQSPC